jgi:hypothetical protein
MAGVDWETVAAATRPGDPGSLGGSSSEVRVLMLAASLAGVTVADSLGNMLSSLDEANTRLVLDAVAHRTGWHEHGLSAHVTGHVAPGATDAADPAAAHEVAAEVRP